MLKKTNELMKEIERELNEELDEQEVLEICNKLDTYLSRALMLASIALLNGHELGDTFVIDEVEEEEDEESPMLS